jgi:hypothetical protein
MKAFALFCLLLLGVVCFGQQGRHDTLHQRVCKPHRPTTATVAVGFSDYYKNYYTMPSGFTKNNTTGFAPVYFKLEYGLSKRMTLTFNFGYDNFLYNYNQLFYGNGVTFSRYHSSMFSVYSGGLSMVYYFNHWLHMKNLETFISAGISLNNLNYTDYPRGDSLAAITLHNATPVIRVGARYYLSDSHSGGIFADAGYDRQSIFSIGLSAALHSKRHLRL